MRTSQFTDKSCIVERTTTITAIGNNIAWRKRSKLISRLCNPSADANFTFPKHLFLLRLPIHLHTLHLTNSILFNELLYPLRHCPPNYNSSHLRYQLCAAALTRMVIPILPNPFANPKVTLPKCLFLLQVHTHNTFRHINRSLLKELFIRNCSFFIISFIAIISEIRS